MTRTDAMPRSKQTAVVVVLTCFVPARRAAAVDPSVTLRAE